MERRGRGEEQGKSNEAATALERDEPLLPGEPFLPRELELFRLFRLLFSRDFLPLSISSSHSSCSSALFLISGDVKDVARVRR